MVNSVKKGEKLTKSVNLRQNYYIFTTKDLSLPF